MFRWIFSDDTEELTELFVNFIGAFMSDLKNKGSDVLRDEIKNWPTKKFSQIAASQKEELH